MHLSKILSSETNRTLPSVVVMLNILLDNIFELDNLELESRIKADEELLLAK